MTKKPSTAEEITDDLLNFVEKINKDELSNRMDQLKTIVDDLEKPLSSEERIQASLQHGQGLNIAMTLQIVFIFIVAIFGWLIYAVKNDKPLDPGYYLKPYTEPFQ